MFEFSEEPRNNGKELLARFLKEKLEVGKHGEIMQVCYGDPKQLEYF